MNREIVSLFGTVCILVWLACAQTYAQPATDSGSATSLTLPEPRLLREGGRAPFTGQLILQEDLLRWAMRIEALEHQLTLDVATEIARCDVRLELERARTTAASERLTLHETLYRERIAELSTALSEARSGAERQWYENPLIWTLVGVIVGGAATALVASVVP